MAVTHTGKETPAVFLEVTKGETLSYSLTVFGPVPTFTLVDVNTDKLLMSHLDTPSATSPNVVYMREWPLPQDKVSVDSNHTLGMHFIASTKYEYKVTHHRKDGTVNTLIDMVYKGKLNDFYAQVLGVTTDI